jgi:two-component system, chemotaxis family, response regulator PixH
LIPSVPQEQFINMVKVLVVEDTPAQMELITLYLRENGYNVFTANNAKDGLELIDKESPDVVVTDVVMEGMNGFEMCRAIKKNPITEKIPVIACTSRNTDLDRLWGMKQGVDAYLGKPFTSEELIRAVKSVAK